MIKLAKITLKWLKLQFIIFILFLDRAMFVHSNLRAIVLRFDRQSR